MFVVESLAFIPAGFFETPPSLQPIFYLHRSRKMDEGKNGKRVHIDQRVEKHADGIRPVLTVVVGITPPEQTMIPEKPEQ